MDTISSGKRHTMSDLHQMQGLPLDTKVKMTQRRIQEWYEAYDREVCVSFSGGKDSTVLLHLARQIYPDMKGVYFLSGIELPSVTQFVKTVPNIEIIRPKRSFISVVKRYGYPVVSKEVSARVKETREYIRKTTGIEPHLFGGGVQNCLNIVSLMWMKNHILQRLQDITKPRRK